MVRFVNLGEVGHAMKETFHSFLSHRRSKENVETASIIESDFEHEKFKDKLESRDPRMNSYGTFKSTAELQQFHTVKQQLFSLFRKPCAKKWSPLVDISSDELNRLAQDVLRMSESEPCGLRGAIIVVVIERKNQSEKLGTIKGDSTGHTTPTYEVYVTFKEDTSRWKAFKKAYLTIKECLLNGIWKESPIVLSSGYQLIKKRLYR